MARNIEGPWYRSSKRTWYATVGGRNVSLGVRGEANEKEATKAWHKFMAEGARPKPPPQPERISLQGVVDAFLSDAVGRLKPNTVRIYRYDLATLCTAHGKGSADALTTAQLSIWLSQLKVSATTKAMTLRSVSACLGWAERGGLIPTNPAKRFPKPKSRSRTAEAVVGEGDHEKLLEAATPEFALVLRVLHGTGCRPGEACRFGADNFDPANGVVLLTEHKADRTGKPRLIFLPPELVGLLKAQAEKFPSGPLLRSNKGVAWSGRSVTQAMRRLKKKAGVKAIAYGYRHGFATRALSRGVPDAHVAALLGHSSTAMLHRHYSHLTSQAQTLREALGKVG